MTGEQLFSGNNWGEDEEEWEQRVWTEKEAKERCYLFNCVKSEVKKKWFSENDTDFLQMLLDIYEWVAWNTEENLVRGN